MSDVLVYKNSQGSVVITAPASNSKLTTEELTQKVVPTGNSYLIMDSSELPDKDYMEAWEIE